MGGGTKADRPDDARVCRPEAAQGRYQVLPDVSAVDVHAIGLFRVDDFPDPRDCLRLADLVSPFYPSDAIPATKAYSKAVTTPTSRINANNERARWISFPSARPKNASRVDKSVGFNAGPCVIGGSWVLTVETGKTKFGDLESAPHHLRVVKAKGRGYIGFGCVVVVRWHGFQLELGPRRKTVLLLDKPRNEDRLVQVVAGLALLERLEELAGWPARGGLKDNLGAGQQGDALDGGREMRLGVFPVRGFGAVQEVDVIAAPAFLVASGGHGVRAFEAGEGQLLGVVGADFRREGVVLLKPLDHPEQRFGGRDFVAQDVDLAAEVERRLPVVARGHVGGEALAPALKPDHTHHTNALALLLDGLMQPPLAVIELEGREFALLGQNL